MRRSRGSAPALVGLAALVALSSGLVGGRPAAAFADAAGDSRSADHPRASVVVTGRGEVSGEPDTLLANFAVETSAPTVDEALNRATAAATRMRNTLLREGVARADLQTSNVGIGSTRNDDGRITGYTVHQGLTAKIRAMPRAGAVMSAAIAAGGDAARLNGVSFAIEDDAALLTEARRKAFADARGRAELYAREAGGTLGRVVRVSDAAPGYGGPGEQDKTMAADAPVLIEPGRQRLAVTVTVEWALLPAAGTPGPRRQP